MVKASLSTYFFVCLKPHSQPKLAQTAEFKSFLLCLPFYGCSQVSSTRIYSNARGKFWMKGVTEHLLYMNVHPLRVRGVGRA